MNSPRPFAPHPSIASNSAVLFPRQHHPRPIPPQLLTRLTPNPPPSSKQSPTYLNKPNLRRLLPKSLPAHVESVLADQPRVLAAAGHDASIASSVSSSGRDGWVGINWEGGDVPLARSLAVDAGAGVPDAFVGHDFTVVFCVSFPATDVCTNRSGRKRLTLIQRNASVGFLGCDVAFVCERLRLCEVECWMLWLW